METAPTDGTEILTYNGLSYDIASVGWWYGDTPVWYNGDCTIQPTHWMPLPEPPKE